MFLKENKLLLAIAPLSLATGIVLGSLAKNISPFALRTNFSSRPTAQSTISPRYSPTTGKVYERLQKLDALLKESTQHSAFILHERARLLLLEARSPSLALKDLDRILKNHSTSDAAAEAMFLRVEALRLMGRVEECKHQATRFLELYPNSWRRARVASIAAKALVSCNKLTEAELLIKLLLAGDEKVKATNIRPAYLDPILMLLGRIYTTMGKYQAADNVYSCLAQPFRALEVFNVSPLRRLAEVRREELAFLKNASSKEELRNIAMRNLKGMLSALNSSCDQEIYTILNLIQFPLTRALVFLRRHEFKKAASAIQEAKSKYVDISTTTTIKYLNELLSLLRLDAWCYPKETIQILTRIDASSIPPKERERYCTILAKAYLQEGDLGSAIKYLTLYKSPALSLELLELARTHKSSSEFQKFKIQIANETEFIKLLSSRIEGAK